MSSRLRALGFPSVWNEHAVACIRRIVRGRTRVIECETGHYRVWQSLQGAELWLHFPLDPFETEIAAKAAAGGGADDALRGLTAITPFHRGTGAVVLDICEITNFDDDEDLGMEGSVIAGLIATEGARRSGDLVIEIVGFGMEELDALVDRTPAQLVCFAHKVWAHPHRNGYIAGTPKDRLIRPGAIRSVTADEFPEVEVHYRQSMVTAALTTGRVLRSVRHRNPVSDDHYYWIELQTAYGVVDVLAHPGQIAGDISVGHLAQVFGSLVARLGPRAS